MDLEKRPKYILLAIGYLSTILLGIIDYYTAADLSFLIFYLLPVILVTYFVGSWAGILISIASTAIWFMANISEFVRDSSTIIPFWNVTEKLCFFFIMVYIVSALKTAKDHEKELGRLDQGKNSVTHQQFGEPGPAKDNVRKVYGIIGNAVDTEKTIKELRNKD